MAFQDCSKQDGYVPAVLHVSWVIVIPALSADGTCTIFVCESQCSLRPISMTKSFEYFPQYSLHE